MQEIEESNHTVYCKAIIYQFYNELQYFHAGLLINSEQNQHQGITHLRSISRQKT